MGRQDVIAYLRALADHPDGVRHRAWLFHAARIIALDRETIFTARSPQLPPQIQEERHGDETI
jgi:hypothetical protein